MCQRCFSVSSAAEEEDHDKSKVGFIGLGNMGRRMAANLMHAGFPVVIHDQSPKAMHDLKESGAESAASPAELASMEGVRVLVTMLPTPESVRDVYLGTDGVLQAARGIHPSLLIDASTVDPQTSMEVARQMRSADLHRKATPFEGCPSSAPSMIDAPVSGGVTGAAAATLTFMVGGEPEAFKAAQPFLKAMGKHALYCGRSGMGQTAKVCNNLALGIQMASIAEALTLGRDLGLDPGTLTAIFNASSARCWSSEVYNPAPGVTKGAPASRDYQGGFATKHMIKDLKLAATAAEDLDRLLPMGAAALDLYEQVAEVDDALDFTAIYKHIYSHSGRPLPRK
ncbi:hypothetical protein WJX73_002793 [Symbiochloris irregularis]|uniref:3-hydroxyisobutyrate dehydrogenase n=1 Tax=Symbiochloris irregularis TaxID=706552 RepID=A0AAW1PVZ4_9CHLO